MRKSKRKIIPVRSTQVTATISVALVLIILGVVALMGIAASSVSRDIRQQLGFVVVMSDTATPDQIKTFKNFWEKAPYVENVKYSSADDVLTRWKEIAGEDDTDDVLLGINPFFPEFEISVKANYANPDSIAKIVAPLEKMATVSDVQVHTDIARAVNKTVRSLTILLLIVAGALLIISFVLINNTIRLTVYSKRFLIHTMKLVGATGGFIRRPFVAGNFLQGMVASFIAVLILGGTLFYLETIDPEILRAITWEGAAAVFAGIFILGTLICTLAALFSANKYLRTDYDEMF